MSYQFYCPAGHLLEAEPEYAGQQCQCPTCGAAMIIPPPPEGYGPAAQQAEPQEPVEDAAEEEFRGLNFLGRRGGKTVDEVPDLGAPSKDDPDRIIHIPCPNGHELETPMSMVGSDAMCPHCEKTFRLKYDNSVEAKAERKKQLELKEERFGRSALRWAIVLASLVLLGLIGLIVAKSLSGS